MSAGLFAVISTTGASANGLLKPTLLVLHSPGWPLGSNQASPTSPVSTEGAGVRAAEASKSSAYEKVAQLKAHIATLVTLHAVSQSASCTRSLVNVLKDCTGDGSRSGGTATKCSADPQSILAALGLMRSSTDGVTRGFPGRRCGLCFIGGSSILHNRASGNRKAAKW